MCLLNLQWSNTLAAYFTQCLIEILPFLCPACRFRIADLSIALSLTKVVDRRTSVADVVLKRCVAEACNIGPALLRNVFVDGLVTDGLLIAWGTVFDKVVLSGKIGKIKINLYAHHSDRSIQGLFDENRRKFYDGVEWAIDIREAEFRECSIRGIPARLEPVMNFFTKKYCPLMSE